MRSTIARATTGNSAWTRARIPNARPSGRDQVNGSRIARTQRADERIARPCRRFYHSPDGQAIAGSAGPALPLGGPVTRQIVHRGRKIQVALDTTVLPD